MSRAAPPIEGRCWKSTSKCARRAVSGQINWHCPENPPGSLSEGLVNVHGSRSKPDACVNNSSPVILFLIKRRTISREKWQREREKWVKGRRSKTRRASEIKASELDGIRPINCSSGDTRARCKKRATANRTSSLDLGIDKARRNFIDESWKGTVKCKRLPRPEDQDTRWSLNRFVNRISFPTNTSTIPAPDQVSLNPYFGNYTDISTKPLLYEGDSHGNAR